MLFFFPLFFPLFFFFFFSLFFKGSNSREYWAEGVQAYFECDQEGPVGGNGVHNDVNTRIELESYDKELYDLLVGAFNVNDGWRPTCGCEDEDRVNYPLAEFEPESVSPTQAPSSTTYSPTNAPSADDVDTFGGSGARLKITFGAIGVSALAGVFMGL